MVGKGKGQTFLPLDFSRVLMQYDDPAGAATTNIEARIAELHDDGVDRNCLPNAVLALFHYPNLNCASGCSASTTSTSPRCRSAATVTSTASG